jgi:hypothetical protein
MGLAWVIANGISLSIFGVSSKRLPSSTMRQSLIPLVWGIYCVPSETILPTDAAPLSLLGAAFLCGIADPFSFYLADQTFQTGTYASVAKLGVLADSAVAAALGTILLTLSPTPATAAR